MSTLFKKNVLLIALFVLGGYCANAQTFAHYVAQPSIALNSTGQIGINITKSTTGALYNYKLKISFPPGITYVSGGAKEYNSSLSTETVCTEDLSDPSTPILNIPTVYGQANSPTHVVFNVTIDCNYSGQPIEYTLYDNNNVRVSGPFNDIPNNTTNKTGVTASGTIIEAGHSATLSATSSIASGAIYTWYSDPALTAASIVHTGATFNTPILNSNTDYYVTVSGPSYCEGAATKVTVLTSRATASDIYAADASVCPNVFTVLKAGSTTITGSDVIFKWYKDETLTTLLHTGETYTTPAISENTTYYVTVQSSTVGENAPGTAKPVNVSISNVCGLTSPGGCSVTGSLLALETFGDAKTTTQTAGPKPPGLVTSYAQSTGLLKFKPDADEYAIVNTTGTNGYPAWYNNLTDHTSCIGTPGTTCGTGYMMIVNVDKAIKSIYQKTITGLCAGTKLFFSAWALSLVESTANSYYPPNITFVLSDEFGNTIGSLATGNIPNHNKSWKQYGFEFTIPANTSSVTLNIMNNQPQTVGNDIAIDDIAIHACVPPVTVTGLSSPYCEGATMSLTTNYTDDGSLGAPLYYQWYYSPTGDLESWDSWTKVGSATTSNVLNDPTPQTGYYRVVIGTLDNIQAKKVYCCAVSDEMFVEIYNTQHVTEITGDNSMCSGTTITLSNATAGGSWTSSNTDVATITQSGQVTGVAPGTTDIKYEVTPTGGCATTVVQTVTVTDCSILPIKFLSFTAVNKNEGVAMAWEVSPDVTNKSFIVQYSSDGKTFSNLVTIPFANNKTTYGYTYTQNFSGTYYFRIVGVDVNNVLTYTGIKKIDKADYNQAEIQVSPNPATELLTLKLRAPKQTNAYIRIFDLRGSEVMHFTKNINTSQTMVPINISSLQAGLYIVQVNYGNEIKSIKFIKSK